MKITNFLYALIAMRYFSILKSLCTIAKLEYVQGPQLCFSSGHVKLCRMSKHVLRVVFLSYLSVETFRFRKVYWKIKKSDIFLL